MAAILDAAYPHDHEKAEFYARRFAADNGPFGRVGYSTQWVIIQLSQSGVPPSELPSRTVADRMREVLASNEEFPLEIYPLTRTRKQFTNDYDAYLKLLTTEHVYNELCCTMYAMIEHPNRTSLLPDAAVTFGVYQTTKFLTIGLRLILTHPQAKHASVIGVAYWIVRMMLPPSVVQRFIAKVRDHAMQLKARAGTPQLAALFDHFIAHVM